jgi:hypothetical protein
MKVILYPNCKLYFFNRESLDFGTIDENLVTAQIIDKHIFYSLIQNHKPSLLIVQALNEKSASAKFLTMISDKSKC